MHLPRSIAITLLAATAALAQQPAAPGNAALDYWRAGAVASSAAAGKETAISKLTWDKIGPSLDAAKMPPEFEAARKEVSDDAVREFLRGAALPNCDFQRHTEDGWKMLLPELAMVRDMTRMVRVDARAKLIAGDAHAASDRTLAMYHAAGHVAREDVFIASLVAVAIARSANDEVKALAASGKLADDDRARLLAAIHQLREGDGLHMTAALEGERRLGTVWFKNEFKGEGAPARFVKELIAINQESPDEKRITDQVAAMKPEEFQASITRMQEFYDKLLEAWSAPDPKAALAPLDASLKNGDYGPVARLIAPSVGRVADARERAHADLDAAAETLKKK
jgi:hypothetical protein